MVLTVTSYMCFTFVNLHVPEPLAGYHPLSPTETYAALSNIDELSFTAGIC